MPTLFQIGQALRQIPGIRRLRLLRLRHWGATAEKRESARLQLAAPHNLFQPSGFTLAFRYPQIFRFIHQELVGSPGPIRLLSFGCSTGEELASLHALFPDSQLTGLDISAHRIAEAASRLRRLQDNGQLHLRVGSSADDLPSGTAPFDAIFAMAVFRHHDLWPRPYRCDHRVRFADYERTITGLARHIRPGGFLCLSFSNFSFAETDIAAEFSPRASMGWLDRMPLYGRDNTRRPDPPHEVVVYQKHPATPAPLTAF